MSSLRYITYLLIAILLAVGLDLLLSRWLRGYLSRNRIGLRKSDQEVRVFGRFSPVLTWLRYRKLPPASPVEDLPQPSPTILSIRVKEAVESGARLWNRALKNGVKVINHVLTQDLPKLLKTPIFMPSQVESARLGIQLGWRSIFLEWGIIFAIVLSFCSGILDLGSRAPLAGTSAFAYEALDWTLVNSIKQYGQFPQWNPYLNNGLPYIADPMCHVFNPLISLSVLVLGVLDGYKIAIFLSILAAALGMWWLGVLLNLGLAVRLWLAFMFAFAGQPLAHFLGGEYLFVFGYAWIPWSVASLIAVMKTRRRLYAVIAIFALAQLFFSGNAYYAFYMIFVVALFALVILTQIRTRKPFLRFYFGHILILIIIGGLTLGIIAIQALPLAEFRPRMPKNLDIAGSHSPEQIFLDYTSKDLWRPDAYQEYPGPYDYYAYIGLGPILALGLLPLTLAKRDKRMILFFLLILVFVILMLDLKQMPWRGYYERTLFFSQFRIPLRVLVYGNIAILSLAGLGLDTVWKMLWAFKNTPGVSKKNAVRMVLTYIGLVALGFLLSFYVIDLYRTNHGLVKNADYYSPPGKILQWLKQYDSTQYFVRNDSNWHYNILEQNLFAIDAWYHIGDIRALKDAVNKRPVRAHPNYYIMGDNDSPGFPDVLLVGRMDGFTIYKLPHSLPITFIVKNSLLADSSTGKELQSEDVKALQPWITGPNGLEIIVQGEEASSLVVLFHIYPGWRVTVDGQRQALKSVSGYLATDLKPGVHKYIFTFQSSPFVVGLVISLVALIITSFLLISDLGYEWQKVLAWASAVRLLKLTIAPLTPENKMASGTDLPVATGIHGLLNASRQWLRGIYVRLRTTPFHFYLEILLFLGALLIYAITRLWALDRFPVYFFADEAAQTLYGQNLIAQHFRDAKGMLFPIYVEAAGFRWTPLLPMYLHALTLTLFGKSIAVTRATSSIVSILGALAAGLTLKSVFKARYSWAVILLLTITPTWFLHSRTAFETVMTTAFYACFLLCYLLYRTKSPRYLYSAVVFGAATFYTYSNAQLIIITAAILLLISDLPYHLKNWRSLLPGTLLTGILAWPLINFRLSQPKAISEHLRAIDSYWFHAIPIQEKLATFIQKYTFGLSPAYWFFPHELDLPRHRWDHLGHISLMVLSLVLVGLLVCLWRIRRTEYRTIILAGLAVPVGAALAGIGITRVLAFVVPANLLAALGLEWLLERLKKWIPYPIAALVIFIALAGTSFAMLRTALVDSPLWFKDYGLYGMQYGAKQLFVDAIPQALEQDPQAQILVTSTWANGADEFIRFFLTSEQQKRVHMESIDSYLFKKLPLDPNKVFIMTASEYGKAAVSPKFKLVRVERLIPYPDGTPGFYFVRLEYADNADEIFAAEKESRRKLLVANLQLWGQPVELHYSQIDMGSPELMFDGDHFTLMRGLEANPFILEFNFSQPRPVTGLEADLGLVDIQVTVMLYTDPTGQPIVYTQKRPNQGDPILKMIFDNPPAQVSKVRIELFNYLTGEVANIHIVELKLLP